MAWTFVTFLAIAFIQNITTSGVASMPVASKTLAYISLATGLISVVLFFYEGVNIANERRIAQRDKRLRLVNAKLNEELGKRYELTLELKKNLGETKKSNQQLEETKHILTRSLENTNRLREQLSIEKQSVEHQIEVRTHQLHEEQARLQASIATLELGFVMTLPDGSVTTYNPALLRICELDSETSLNNLMPHLYKKIGKSYDLSAAIENCLKNGKPFEASDIAAGDKFIRILGSAIHVKGRSGGAIGVVLLFEDMTSAKLLERSEKEFVAIASHELRTPLTIIKGNLSLMEDLYSYTQKNDGVHRMMDDINDSVARMMLIVNQFLSMTRLEQKKTNYVFEPINVDDAVTTALSSLKSLIEGKNLETRMAIPAHLPQIKADVGSLQEVLSNLLSNSVKYTASGYIKVSAEHNKNFVIIRVIDSGKGIAVKNQKLLFHKFQQATDNILTRDDSHSTGLGLYIAKLLVEQMGGSIELEESFSGKGSTFSFKLPII